MVELVFDLAEKVDQRVLIILAVLIAILVVINIIKGAIKAAIAVIVVGAALGVLPKLLVLLEQFVFEFNMVFIPYI